MVKLSSVLGRALEKADVTPQRRDATMERRLLKGMGQMVETDHFPLMIARANGLAVHFIRRRNRHLLIDMCGSGILYRELAPRKCVLVLPGEIPATVVNAFAGELLSTIADCRRWTHLLEEMRIVSSLPCCKGVTALSVEPTWRSSILAPRGTADCT